MRPFGETRSTSDPSVESAVKIAGFQSRRASLRSKTIGFRPETTEGRNPLIAGTRSGGFDRRSPMPSGWIAQMLTSADWWFVTGPVARLKAIHCPSGDQDGKRAAPHTSSPGHGTNRCGFDPSTLTTQISCVSDSGVNVTLSKASCLPSGDQFCK